MITDKTTNIACRCPDCGSTMKTEINIFNLSGKSFNLKCPTCGGSTLTISFSHDGKVRLSVPCLACPHPHPYTLSSNSFFSRDIFILQCSFSGMDICFIGKEEQVDLALQISEKELLSLMDENSEDNDGTANILNPDVMQDILFSIEELAKNKKIRCKCHDGENSPSVSVIIDYDRIILRCKKCGQEKILIAKSTFDASAAAELSEIILE